MMVSGVLFFHSETGTEGGWYAYQLDEFRHLPPPNQWHCKRCNRIWDKDREPDHEPPPYWTYWFPETVEEDGARVLGGYRISYEEHSGWPTGPPDSVVTDFDRKWNEWERECQAECTRLGHIWESPQEQWPDGVWSYEGLRLLGDGQHLKVYDKDRTEVVWEGEVRLRLRNDVYTNADATVFGLWVNQEPDVGVDRETWAKWFFDELPCDVIEEA